MRAPGWCVECKRPRTVRMRSRPPYGVCDECEQRSTVRTTVGLRLRAAGAPALYATKADVIHLARGPRDPRPRCGTRNARGWRTTTLDVTCQRCIERSA
jgi:hypothetical protein